MRSGGIHSRQPYLDFVPAESRCWPPILRFSHEKAKLNDFFVDSNDSKAHRHPLISFRIFDPTELYNVRDLRRL